MDWADKRARELLRRGMYLLHVPVREQLEKDIAAELRRTALTTREILQEHAP